MRRWSTDTFSTLHSKHMSEMFDENTYLIRLSTVLILPCAANQQKLPPCWEQAIPYQDDKEQREDGQKEPRPENLPNDKICKST